MPAPSYDIVVNANAGTVLQLGREAIETKISASGIAVNAIHFMEAADLSDKLTQLKKEKANILLMGGDGTIAGAVGIFMDGDLGFGIIPMGTMNLLARDLGIPVDMQAAMNAYAPGYKQVKIDVGLANSQPFLCCAALGIMPEAAELREENRGEAAFIMVPRLAMFVFRQLDPLNRKALRVTLDGKRKHMRASALVISNNLFSEDDASEAGLKKDTLQGGHLGVYSVSPYSWWDKMRFMLRLKLGGWKKDAIVSELVAHKVIVRTRKRIEKISLDGETMDVKTPLLFSIRRKAAIMLVPLPEVAA